jgi:hypothetical protein
MPPPTPPTPGYFLSWRKKMNREGVKGGARERMGWREKRKKTPK